ncbi:MAG: Methyltransferase type 11 [Candidatus Adlerbacteria bacterium]|nr:Methyltransferase type 11 [Candidatus Adlerbacteria bacterium]
MKYTTQVGTDHYHGKSYRQQDRWNSYFHQLFLVRQCNPASVLEIGVGEGTVARELRNAGVEVITLDIDPDLKPDVVGSITEMPVVDKSVDVVLAAEVLEHIEFTDVPQALRELKRAARTHVVVGLPHPGWVFSVAYKLPLLPRIELIGKIPFFWKEHAFNGQHYWELGKKGYPVARFVDAAREAGLTLVSNHVYQDDPAHRFFIFSV